MRLQIVLIILAMVGLPLVAAGLDAGAKAPEIDVRIWKNSTGERLADLKGRVVVVEFWATWCGPCMKAIPHVINLYNELKPKGLAVIGLTDEMDTAKVEGVIKDLNIPYPVGLGSTSGIAYGVDSIPRAFIIDPEGMIAWTGNPLMEAFETELRAALEKAPPVVETPKISKEEVEAYLKEAQKNTRQALGSEADAMQFLAELTAKASPYFDDKDVSRSVLKIASDFLLKADSMDVKIEAVSLIGRFENNDMAASILMQMLNPFLVKGGLESKGILTAIFSALPRCGRFNSRIPAALANVFESKYDVNNTVKSAALDALGQIRTFASLDTVINIMPKICPYPHEPNVWHLAGNDAKQAMWDETRQSFYNAIFSLTGEGSSGFGSEYNSTPYVDWKKLITKNKTAYMKRFKKEEEEATKTK